MRKFISLLFIISIILAGLYAQEKKEIIGNLEKVSKKSITLNGKAYEISDDVVIKEKDGEILKNEEDKLDLKILRAVERVRLILVDEKVREILIEVRRE
ncbi:MAG: hypothetical protein ACUVUG_05040 [Candidatus Aminicenantia bacterium]